MAFAAAVVGVHAGVRVLGVQLHGLVVGHAHDLAEPVVDERGHGAAVGPHPHPHEAARRVVHEALHQLVVLLHARDVVAADEHRRDAVAEGRQLADVARALPRVVDARVADERAVAPQGHEQHAADALELEDVALLLGLGRRRAHVLDEHGAPLAELVHDVALPPEGDALQVRLLRDHVAGAHLVGVGRLALVAVELEDVRPLPVEVLADLLERLLDGLVRVLADQQEPRYVVEEHELLVDVLGPSLGLELVGVGDAHGKLVVADGRARGVDEAGAVVLRLGLAHDVHGEVAAVAVQHAVVAHHPLVVGAVADGFHDARAVVRVHGLEGVLRVDLALAARDQVLELLVHVEDADAAVADPVDGRAARQVVQQLLAALLQLGRGRGVGVVAVDVLDALAAGAYAERGLDGYVAARLVAKAYAGGQHVVLVRHAPDRHAELGQVVGVHERERGGGEGLGHLVARHAQQLAEPIVREGGHERAVRPDGRPAEAARRVVHQALHGLVQVLELLQRPLLLGDVLDEEVHFVPEAALGDGAAAVAQVLPVRGIRLDQRERQLAGHFPAASRRFVHLVAQARRILVGQAGERVDLEELPEGERGVQRLAELLVGADDLAAVLGELRDARAADVAVEDERLERCGAPERAAVQHVDRLERVGVAGLLAGVELLLERREGQGTVVEVALHDRAADGAEEVGLLPRLHPFGDDLHADPLRHADDRLDDVAAASGAVLAGQEHHVELQHVGGHVLEHVEGGVAAAEIVDLDGEPALLQPLHHRDDERGVERERRLRDLEAQQLGGYGVGFYEAGDALVEIVLQHVDARDVHRDGQRLLPFVEPAAQQLAHLLPDVLVQLVDEPVALEHGHERVRRDHGVLLGAAPAHEGLGARHGAGLVVVLGLQPHLELPFGQRVVHVADDALLLDGPAAHLVVEVGDRHVVTALHRALREQRVVRHLADRDALVVDEVAPDAQLELEVDVSSLEHAFQRRDEVGQQRGRVGGQQQLEVVGRHAAGDAVVGVDEVGDDAADLLQHEVAGRAPVLGVHGLEVVHVATR